MSVHMVDNVLTPIFSRSERRATLQTHYHFLCECPGCLVVQVEAGHTARPALAGWLVQQHDLVAAVQVGARAGDRHLLQA